MKLQMGVNVYKVSKFCTFSETMVPYSQIHESKALYFFDWCLGREDLLFHFVLSNIEAAFKSFCSPISHC